jgi:nucleoside-diphosphate-sugar epimerase
VLLLGGTGFIGSRVLNILRRRSDIKLMVLGHRRVNYRALEDVNLVVDDFARFDFAWLELFKPDTIIHLARFAGRGPLGRSIASRRGAAANRRLRDWLTVNAPDVHVIYVSGSLVYGDHGDEEVNEQAQLHPVGFARQYIHAERPWMHAQADGTLPVTILRPPWIVGPESWFYSHFAAAAQSRGFVPMYGSGQNWMSLIDVSDCAGLIVHVAETVDPGRIVNLFAPGQHARHAEFAECLSKAMALSVRPIERTSEYMARDSALWEALTFSLKVATRHRDIYSNFEFQVPDWRDMVIDNLRSIRGQ